MAGNGKSAKQKLSYTMYNCTSATQLISCNMQNGWHSKYIMKERIDLKQTRIIKAKVVNKKHQNDLLTTKFRPHIISQQEPEKQYTFQQPTKTKSPPFIVHDPVMITEHLTIQKQHPARHHKTSQFLPQATNRLTNWKATGSNQELNVQQNVKPYDSPRLPTITPTNIKIASFFTQNAYPPPHKREIFEKKIQSFYAPNQG